MRWTSGKSILTIKDRGELVMLKNKERRINSQRERGESIRGQNKRKGKRQSEKWRANV